MQFQTGCNKEAIELQDVQFWPDILVISNQTSTARSFNFEIMRMILDQIALHSVQSPLLNSKNTTKSPKLHFKDLFLSGHTMT